MNPALNCAVPWVRHFIAVACEVRGARAFSEGGRGGGPGAHCPPEAPSLMTPCPTPAWPLPCACLLVPATLMGPSRALPLLRLHAAPWKPHPHSGGFTVRAACAASSLPAQTSHWHPTPPFQSLPAPLDLPGASNSVHPRPRHHVSQPAPPSTQHHFPPSVQSQVCSSCLTPLSPSAQQTLKSTHCPRPAAILSCLHLHLSFIPQPQ